MYAYAYKKHNIAALELCVICFHHCQSNLWTRASVYVFSSFALVSLLLYCSLFNVWGELHVACTLFWVALIKYPTCHFSSFWVLATVCLPIPSDRTTAGNKELLSDSQYVGQVANQLRNAEAKAAAALSGASFTAAVQPLSLTDFRLLTA